MRIWFTFLDYFFFAFHTLLILFNSLGWLVRKWRRWNLFTLLLTAFSWFVIGIWYGWGYCFCTDWHWVIRARLGYHDQTNSYTHFLVLKLTGIYFSPKFVDTITALVFFLSLLISVLLNIRDHRKRQLKRI